MTAQPSRDLNSYEAIVNEDDTPTMAFQRRWQEMQRPPRYLVADLPATKVLVGSWAYATDLCVFDGAGTQETTGNGTGGLVSYNGSNWVIAGTNVTASA